MDTAEDLEELNLQTPQLPKPRFVLSSAKSSDLAGTDGNLQIAVKAHYISG